MELPSARQPSQPASLAHLWGCGVIDTDDAGVVCVVSLIKRFAATGGAGDSDVHKTPPLNNIARNASKPWKAWIDTPSSPRRILLSQPGAVHTRQTVQAY